MKEIYSWEDVDIALRELGEQEIKKSMIEGRLNESLNEAKARAKEEVAPILKSMKHIVKMIELFAASKKEEFAKKRSKEFTFGKVGYRLVTSIPLPRDKNRVETLLNSLKAYGLSDCIKFEEKPDKDRLVELDDKTLVKLGLQKRIKDSFRVEPNIEKIKGAE